MVQNERLERGLGAKREYPLAPETVQAILELQKWYFTKLYSTLGEGESRSTACNGHWELESNRFGPLDLQLKPGTTGEHGFPVCVHVMFMNPSYGLVYINVFPNHILLRKAEVICDVAVNPNDVQNIILESIAIVTAQANRNSTTT